MAAGEEDTLLLREGIRHVAITLRAMPPLLLLRRYAAADMYTRLRALR